MKVIIEGLLSSVYRTPDFKNKETGEITEGKYKLQLLVDNVLTNGSVEKDILRISIPENQVKEYEAQVDNKIQVICQYFSKSQVSFYVN